MKEVIIRVVTESDINSLNKNLPAIPGRHEWRLNRQLSGEAIYLIASSENTFIGCILLDYKGFMEERIQSELGIIPDINILQVSEHYRNQGIGTKLLQEALVFAKKNHFGKVGVLVGKENQKARNLYMKYGFKESGLGDFMGTNKLFEKGRLNNYPEVATYLVKDLD